MSLNVIVIAVIALAVLVVLIVIMAGKTSLFSKSAASCEAKGAGASCIAEGAFCDGARYTFGTDCAKRFEEGSVAGPHCCVPMGAGVETKKSPSSGEASSSPAASA